MPYEFWSGRQVRNTKLDSLNPEIDEIRSYYPVEPLSQAGWYNYDTSQVYTALISAVPSSKVFLLKKIFIDNEQVNNRLIFYDASGTNVSATMFPIHMAASTTVLEDMGYLPFLHGVYVSNLDSQISVRIHGILVTSGE